jgi:hypothetical protein
MVACHSLQRMAIFAGPSRSPSLDPGGARIFPPARSGDIGAAAGNGFSHIVLADTLFLDVPPNHREIMAVIGSGATVFGCGSAGALRAIELGGEGMLGRGVIHELYQTRRLLDDSELACVIGDNYLAITPPLIDIRYYLGYRLALGDPLQRVARAFDALNSIYYMRRDYGVVCRVIAEQLGADNRRICRSIEDPAFRLKSIDLENCLADIALAMQGNTGAFRRVDVDRAWLDGGLMFGA